MAEHAEAHGKHESSEKKKKHGSWFEQLRASLHDFALGTILANALLVTTLGVAFPPYIMSIAIMAGLASFIPTDAPQKKVAQKAQGSGGGHGGAHGHGH